MFLAVSVVIFCLMLLFLLRIRPSDLPEPVPVSPFHHLDARKAAIYEGLRDLQFEYRLGKLSDEDYQRTKRELQSQLAGIMAEIDRIKAEQPQPAAVKAAAASKKGADGSVKSAGATVCPHCKAKFDRVLKFCGECGKSMTSAEGAA
jgi:hypothetical protein